MSDIPVQATATEQWRNLVKEAIDYNGVNLDEELESYLVFLLMRYMKETTLTSKVMALEYIRGLQSPGPQRNECMRDVGDQCLLFSGLYPEVAERRQVRISYYVKMGRSAYASLSGFTQSAIANMYSHLAESFVSLMDTLQAMRCMNDSSMQLQPLMAYELWQDTRSQQARRVLLPHEQYNHTPCIGSVVDEKPIKH
ncbi:hypothetical protein MNBD_GAMMA21-2275 [hydrothermal vent metagenome]|uniref:Uncharacterized protein n=1 Tax=hydrothermal vent metagenome TaxID=652676 RepID=A0A3B0ZUF2_9ZZZZ